MIKVLVFDIDGSIMPQGGPINPRVANFLLLIQKAGLLMGPATGKNADYSRGLFCGFGGVPDFVIAETGAQFLECISRTPPCFSPKETIRCFF